MLNPALALVSINMTPNSRDFASPSSIETCLILSPSKQYLENLLKDGQVFRVSMNAKSIHELQI